MDDEFSHIGVFFLGGFTVAAVVFAVWHIGEGKCQEQNNVHDCVVASPVFVPAEVSQ